MNLKARLSQAESMLRQRAQRIGCPGCKPRMITIHEEHQLETGEVVMVPPIPPLVPCTCGRKKPDGMQITAIIIARPRR
jgi:hypothetical protein